MHYPTEALLKRSSLGQNRENLRQHNLSVILRLLHVSGLVPRSHLTGVTGLNRSTISDLIGELTDLGLTEENEALSAGSVGRPSLTVTVSKNVVAFAVNIEREAITVGVVNFNGRVLKRVRRPFGEALEPKAAAKVAAEIITELRADLADEVLIAGIGVAVPGQVRVQDGVVREAAHLGWTEVPLATILTQVTGLPVRVDNNATNACIAERLFGASRGSSNSVFLYSSSGGIGGGVIANDQLLRGVSGYASELGHIQISSSKTEDFFGIPGTLEALVRRDDLLYAFHRDSATDEDLDDLILHNASTRVTKVIAQQVEALGRALGVLATVFNPETIVLSGFLGSIFKSNPDRLLNMVRENSIKPVTEALVVKVNELGSSAVLIGGAELAFQAVLESPAGVALTRNRRTFE